jgi:hypothetical protein
MRDYQIRGLNWMISLYENGINGILADEMVGEINRLNQYFRSEFIESETYSLGFSRCYIQRENNAPSEKQI